MSITEREIRSRLVLVWTTIGAIGFGVWMESIAAYFFVWPLLYVLLGRLSR